MGVNFHLGGIDLTQGLRHEMLSKFSDFISFARAVIINLVLNFQQVNVSAQEIVQTSVWCHLPSSLAVLLCWQSAQSHKASKESKSNIVTTTV